MTVSASGLPSSAPASPQHGTRKHSAHPARLLRYRISPCAQEGVGAHLLTASVSLNRHKTQQRADLAQDPCSAKKEVSLSPSSPHFSTGPGAQWAPTWPLVKSADAGKLGGSFPRVHGPSGPSCILPALSFILILDLNHTGSLISN